MQFIYSSCCCITGINRSVLANIAVIVDLLSCATWLTVNIIYCLPYQSQEPMSNLQKVVIVSITKNVCKLGVDTAPVAVNEIQPIVNNFTHF